MDRTYDIFELVDVGAPLWKKAVVGHEAAIAFARQVAQHTPNEVQVMHLPTKALIARLNPKDDPGN
jgi:hypothetical protein